MLLLAAFCHLITAVTFVLRLEYTPQCCLERSTALSVSRVGSTPSYDVSVSRFGFSPSYEISISRVGSSPSYALTSAYVGSTPSFEACIAPSDSTSWNHHCICHVDPAMWNESGAAEPSAFVLLLLVPRIFATFLSLVCFFISCLSGLGAFIVHGLCDTLFVGVRALLFAGLRAMVLLGLYGFLFIAGFILFFAGGLSMVINLTFELAFFLVAVLSFCGLCGCVFVALTGYKLYTIVGPRGTPVLGFYLATYCVSSSSPVVDFCTFFYYSYLACVNSGAVRPCLYFELIASTGVWFVKVFEAIHVLCRFFWRPLFFYGLYTTYFVYCLCDTLLTYGLYSPFSSSVDARFLLRQLRLSLRKIYEL